MARDLTAHPDMSRPVGVRYLRATAGTTAYDAGAGEHDAPCTPEECDQLWDDINEHNEAVGDANEALNECIAATGSMTFGLDECVAEWEALSRAIDDQADAQSQYNSRCPYIYLGLPPDDCPSGPSVS